MKLFETNGHNHTLIDLQKVTAVSNPKGNYTPGIPTFLWSIEIFAGGKIVETYECLGDATKDREKLVFEWKNAVDP